MRKRIYVVVTVVTIAAIIFILLNNKRTIEMKARPDMETVFPVVVMDIKRQNVVDSLTVVGSVTGGNDVNVISETTGRVKQVNVKIGDFVKAGTSLLKVDDELSKAQLLSAQASYDKAKKDYERNQKLRQEDLISDSQLESSRQTFNSAEAAYIQATRQYNNTAVTAPISGVITSFTVEPGTYLTMGNLIANIVNINSLKLRVNITEQDVIHLKTGDPVHITTDVYPTAKYNGHISSISAKGTDIHTYPVEVGFENNNQYPLKAGMFVKASFYSNQQHLSLTIPRDALIGSAKNPQVYVVENGVAKLREIILGVESGTDREIKGGLKEGDVVVISGQDNLIDNATVTIVNQ
jgi:RND family efflux transporter MFP subunit